MYEVPSVYNTTLAVREGLHGREIAGVCGLCDEVEGDGVGGQVGLGSPRVRERRDYLIYDVTDPSVQPDAVTIMQRP